MDASLSRTSKWTEVHAHLLGTGDVDGLVVDEQHLIGRQAQAVEHP